MRTLLVSVLLFTFGCATESGTGVSQVATKNTLGCLVTVSTATGSAFYEPLIILGEREGVDEDGNPLQEWWVYFPGRPKEDYVDLDGNLRAVNVPKYKVLVRGEHRIIGPTACKCPE